MSVNIGVIGLGFVGLTTALGFADKGFTVRGYDLDTVRRNTVSSGEIPFFEPGLGDILKRTLGDKFIISESSEDAVVNSDAVFICVGTPTSGDGSADLRFLLSAAGDVCGCAADGRKRLVAVKSTVPPGTTDGIVVPYMREHFDGFDEFFSVAANPEFLREGHCCEDFVSPDRIICGVNDAWAERIFAEIYAPFGAPVRFVTPGTAEFIKYLSNAFLATLISFSNEMSLIAGQVGGIDIGRAFDLLHEDKRWRGTGVTQYAYPGCGYGGYCLPKDTAALAARSKQLGFEPRVLNSVISLNSDMPSITARKIERLAGAREANIGILGLSFKPESDDVRDTPAAKIIRCLILDGYTSICVYDPVATEAFRDMYGFDITYCRSKEAVCELCDTVAVVTMWPEFKGINRKYPQKQWCDCRYFLDKQDE